MHPLHNYVASQVAERLRAKTFVVWYDPRREFAAFVDEARRPTADNARIAGIELPNVSARLAEYAGSFFELRALVEPYAAGDKPDPLLVYLPGVERDRRGSVLMELEKAGECYEPSLKQLARHVLRQRYTDGVIDGLLATETVTYRDLAQASSESSSTEPPSMLKVIFADVRGNGEALLSEWLSDAAHDHEIAAKSATPELAKLLSSRLGLQAAAETPLDKLRAIALRYVFVGEFRADLRGPAPSNVVGIAAPPTKDFATACRTLATRLRVSRPMHYAALADAVERELDLSAAAIDPAALGSIDTFRFEERALLTRATTMVAAGDYAAALELVAEREDSYWLKIDVERKAHWEAVRRMAELGQVAARVLGEVPTFRGTPPQWVAAYAGTDGWFRLDQAQRRLERWLSSLREHPDGPALDKVRRAYEDACHAMATAFAQALVSNGWSIDGVLPQTHVFQELVAPRQEPVAYILVDAMRYEMGAELVERLPKTAEVRLRPAVAALPTITPMGMAALHPGAAASYSVVEDHGELAAQIEGVLLPDLPARKKYFASRVPALVDLALDDLLELQRSALKRKIANAPVVVVRSQEIDKAGETISKRQARRIMDEVIDDLATAVHRLSEAGVAYAVISADHGHLYFGSTRDESMKVEAPGGATTELHRRCWIGRGGKNPPGCIRVTGRALGYDTNLDFVFPAGTAIFKTQGDADFNHGGPSLQELLVPVVTVRLATASAAKPAGSVVEVAGIPDRITNRIFSVSLRLGLRLFATSQVVRPVLVTTSGRVVGTVGMASGGELDHATGTVRLEPGKTVTVGFMLPEEELASIQVLVQDPATDAPLGHSPQITVQLGIKRA